MTVRRIVANIGTESIEAAKAFYGGVLGMTVAMDLGWIVTFATDALATPQVSVAMEGGSGTPVPDLSVEVNNLYEVCERALAAGLPVEYGPTIEPWGVKRFYVRHSYGRLFNILVHT